MTSNLDQLITQGFAEVGSFLSASEIDDLRARFSEVVSASPNANARQFSTSSQILLGDLEKKLGDLLKALGLGSPHLVRILLFNKTQNQNWFVPWHQDRTIAVQQRHEMPGYLNWTRKNGEAHVEPPVSLLEDMVTLRIHLDPFGAKNGGLRVIAGSHRHGRLEQPDIATLQNSTTVAQTEGSVGDVLVMRPLLVHASKKSQDMSPRRILHLEFSNQTLPRPLEWLIP